MTNVNNKPIKTPSFPLALDNWPLLVPVVYGQACLLMYAKEINHPIKKDVWCNVWKSAKALYYFYQNETKPYTEKNNPELIGEIQKHSEMLNECFNYLKILHRHASRNKLWAKN